MPRKDLVMSGEDLQVWQDRMGWNDSRAVEELGLGSRNTWARYKTEGAPLYIALACAALMRNIAPWPK